MLPGKSGYDFAKTLRLDQRTKLLPIIFLTAKSNEIDKIMALEDAGDDYLTKPFSPKELIARIKAVSRRTAPHLNTKTCQIGAVKLDPEKREVFSSNQKINLSPTEFKILHFFLTHPNKLYTRNQIMDFVWGDNVFIDDRTIDVHIRGIRKALEKTNNHKVIKTVWGSGYIFNSDYLI